MQAVSPNIISDKTISKKHSYEVSQVIPHTIFFNKKEILVYIDKRKKKIRVTIKNVTGP